MSVRRRAIGTTTCLVILAHGVALLAQVGGPGESDERSGSRVVKYFDFYEPQNLEALPMFWQRVDSSGFPHFASGQLDESRGRNAPPSFYLDSNGGSVGYYYYARGIPAGPGSDYEVSLWVKPRNLEHARFFASAWFMDRFGHRIRGTERSSDPIVGRGAEEGWVRLRFVLPGDVSNARLMSIGLYVVQPEVFAKRQDSFRPIVSSDVSAGAWVDDITVLRLPRIRLHCVAEGSVFTHEETPTIEAEVTDSDARGLSAELVVRSADGQVKWRRSVPTSLEGAEKSPRYEVPNLDPGFYTAALHIRADGREVRAPRVSFVLLARPVEGIRAVTRGFGLRIEQVEDDQWATVERLTELLDIWQVKVPVWSEGRPGGWSSGASAGQTSYLGRLYRRNGLAVAVLEGVPKELGDPASAGDQSLMDLFNQTSQDWGPFLKYALARYASFVEYWQIGADGDREVVWDPRMPATIERLAGDFEELITNPLLVSPWSVQDVMPTEPVSSAALSLHVPASIHPDEFANHYEPFRALPYASRWLTVEALDSGRYERLGELSDFTRRIVAARATGADIVFADQPWHTRQLLGRTIIEPTERFVILRTLSSVLGNSRFLTRLHLGKNVSGHLFERDGAGVAVLWNDRAPPEGTELTLHLGGAPRKISVWGEVSRLSCRENGEHTLTVGRMPIIIDGVSAQLMRLMSLVRLVPPFIESSLIPHEVELQLTNPYRRPISGRVRLDVPVRWDVSPQHVEFALKPDQMLSKTVTIRFPPTETVGRKNILAHVTLDSEREYELQIPLVLEIGLSDIRVTTFAQTVGDQVVVRQRVTNYSREVVNFDGYVIAPERPRQTRLIARLQPGQTVLKEYEFPDARDLIGRRLRAGLRELDGSRTHNELIEVP